MLHSEGKTEEESKAYSHDDTIQNSRCKVDLVIAASVDQRVHPRPCRAAVEHQDRDRYIPDADADDIRLTGEKTDDLCREEDHERRQYGIDRNRDREDRLHYHADAFITPCSDVLANHRRTGSIERIGEQIGDASYLVRDP